MTLRQDPSNQGLDHKQQSWATQWVLTYRKLLFKQQARLAYVTQTSSLANMEPFLLSVRKVGGEIITQIADKGVRSSVYGMHQSDLPPAR